MNISLQSEQSSFEEVWQLNEEIRSPIVEAGGDCYIRAQLGFPGLIGLSTAAALYIALFLGCSRGCSILNSIGYIEAPS